MLFILRSRVKELKKIISLQTKPRDKIVFLVLSSSVTFVISAGEFNDRLNVKKLENKCNNSLSQKEPLKCIGPKLLFNMAFWNDFRLWQHPAICKWNTLRSLPIYVQLTEHSSKTYKHKNGTRQIKKKTSVWLFSLLATIVYCCYCLAFFSIACIVERFLFRIERWVHNAKSITAFEKSNWCREIPINLLAPCFIRHILSCLDAFPNLGSLERLWKVIFAKWQLFLFFFFGSIC